MFPGFRDSLCLVLDGENMTLLFDFLKHDMIMEVDCVHYSFN